MSPANQKILQQLVREISAHRESLDDPMAMRYTSEQKSAAVSLVNQGISSRTISNALGISAERLRLWKLKHKPKSIAAHGFKEVAVIKSAAPPAPQTQQEARIVTKSGLTIFIPLSALTPTLLVSLGGC